MERADPPDPDLMTRPPRDPQRGLLGRESLRPLALGTTLATAVIATYVIALRSWPVAEARAFARSSFDPGRQVGAYLSLFESLARDPQPSESL